MLGNVHCVSVGKTFASIDRSVKIQLVIKPPRYFSISEISCDCMITETQNNLVP